MEDIFAHAGKRGAPAKYPYSKMDVGEVVEIVENTVKSQIAAHVYGRTKGWKFATRTIDGVLYVKRVS